MKAGNSGGCLLPYWKNICDDENNNGKITNFIKSSKTSSPTPDSGASILPPIGNAFMYIETSSGHNGNNVFCSFERTDFIQITNIRFYYNRLSILTNNLSKSMGRSRIQLLLEDNTWTTRYTIAKNSNTLIHQQSGLINIALEKLKRQRNLKEINAMDLLEKQFSNQSK